MVRSEFGVAPHGTRRSIKRTFELIRIWSRRALLSKENRSNGWYFNENGMRDSRSRVTIGAVVSDVVTAAAALIDGATAVSIRKTPATPRVRTTVGHRQSAAAQAVPIMSLSESNLIQILDAVVAKCDSAGCECFGFASAACPFPMCLFSYPWYGLTCRTDGLQATGLMLFLIGFPDRRLLRLLLRSEASLQAPGGQHFPCQSRGELADYLLLSSGFLSVFPLPKSFT